MNPTHRTDDKAVSLVEAMSAYVSSGLLPPVLVSAEGLIGASHLRLICISLLSWLKSRARISKMTEMKIKEAGSAKESLLLLLGEDGNFSSVFLNHGDKVLLRSDLDLHEVDEIVAAADELYQPPRFITRRREDLGG